MFRSASAFQSLRLKTGIRAGVAGGGGAAGGIGRDGAGATGADDPEDQPVTTVQMNKAITAGVQQALRKFKTDWGGELKKEFATAITESLTALAPEIDKIVEGRITALRGSGATGGDGGGGAGATGGSAPLKVTETPEYKGLQKQLENLNTKVTESEKRELAAKEAAKNVRLRQRVGEVLVKKGIDPTRVRLAVGQLLDVDKRVRIEGEGEDEQIVMRDGADDVDFETGADAWLRTDEAKIYLPPRGAAGSGDRGGGRRAGVTTQGKTKNEASLEDLGNFVLGASAGLPLGGGGTR